MNFFTDTFYHRKKIEILNTADIDCLLLIQIYIYNICASIRFVSSPVYLNYTNLVFYVCQKELIFVIRIIYMK